MGRRKEELSSARVDQDWPHQVAIPEARAMGANPAIIRAFCKELSLCSRGHAVAREGEWWQVFCFADKEHAEKFMQHFGGEDFYPKQKWKGRNWARWRK